MFAGALKTQTFDQFSVIVCCKNLGSKLILSKEDAVKSRWHNKNTPIQLKFAVVHCLSLL